MSKMQAVVYLGAIVAIASGVAMMSIPAALITIGGLILVDLNLGAYFDAVKQTTEAAKRQR